MIKGLKPFLKKCRRVWKVLKKPTRKEWLMVAKISSIGILVLGFIGFLISSIMKSLIN